jgi:hypothetical protein
MKAANCHLHISFLHSWNTGSTGNAAEKEKGKKQGPQRAQSSPIWSDNIYSRLFFIHVGIELWSHSAKHISAVLLRHFGSLATGRHGKVNNQTIARSAAAKTTTYTSPRVHRLF